MSDKYCLECASPLPDSGTGGLCSVCALRGALTAGSESATDAIGRGASEPNAGTSPVAAGSGFGNYEMLGEIGRGGMGIVYRAKDLTLGRKVAVKFLPEEFARDADRVARFQREAKLLASINHPNIAAIYGLEKSGGTNFLVLELVEGETLAAQLKNGPIPAGKSVELALQIAEALEAAHEKGVIHRDLKPANIKVTPDDKVKVLDFGLAKAFMREPAELNLTNSPTLSVALTGQGVILGTAAYMSPEQAKAKPVDKRADIWAFGCVLYEMLTGRAAFHGDDISEIFASVIKGDIDLDALPADMNRDIRKLLNRCLQKDLKKRYQDIGDVRFDLEQLPSGDSQPEAAPGTGRQRRWAFVLPWLVGVITATAIVAGLAVWNLKPREPRPIVRLSCILPPNLTLTTIDGQSIAISPDGSRFVCATNGGIYLRLMDQLQGRIIPGTEGQATNAFFSPDGQWVGFWSKRDKKMKKIPVSGGQPVTLCDEEYIVGALWNADNSIFYDTANKGILRVSANGGTPEKIYFKSKSEGSYAPQLLPDRTNLLLTLIPFVRPMDSKIAVQSLRSGKQKELFAGGGARYLDTGHLVYVKGGDLFAVPFDVNKLEPTGNAVPMVQGIASYAVSDSGALLYVQRAETPPVERILVWVDRNGKELVIDAPPRAYTYAHLSRDGTRVALDIRDQENDIWILDLARRLPLARLTFDPGMNRNGIWTPDGEKVAFSGEGNGGENIWLQSADGSGSPEPLTRIRGAQLLPHAFTPDGKQLLITETYTSNVRLLDIDRGAEPKQLFGGEFTGSNPDLSYDGRWIAYQSDKSGRSEIYVCPFPDVNAGRWQITTEGGTRPLWNKNGREIFYFLPPGIMMSVPVETETPFKAGRPRVLFKGEYLESAGITQYSVTPDGRRFLMIKDANPKPTGTAPPQQINVILNWLEELKQRVPVK
jgi:eukaryotic-like serine/threonine-protein kinase